MIPKIVHKTGPFNSIEELPEEIKNIYKLNIISNKEYKFIYYNDEDCINIIKKFDPLVYEAYNSLTPTAYKADIFRMVILYLKGGIYSDLPQQFIKPLKTFVDHSKDLIFIENMEIAFIAAKPKSDIIKYIIDYQINNVLFKRYGENVFDITGPNACLKAYNIFFNFRQYKNLIMNNYIINKFNISIIGRYVHLKETDFYKINNRYSTNIFDTKYIVDIDNLNIIKLYSKNYHNLMYKNKPIKYSNYYLGRCVFGEKFVKNYDIDKLNQIFIERQIDNEINESKSIQENKINESKSIQENKEKIISKSKKCRNKLKKIFYILNILAFISNLYLYLVSKKLIELNITLKL